MRKGAEEPGTMSQEVEARPGLKQYLDKGYYNASIQLEYTSADFAIAQFALHAVGDEFASWRYFHLHVHGRICITRKPDGCNHVILMVRGNR